jgi:hypothetical protein
MKRTSIIAAAIGTVIIGSAHGQATVRAEIGRLHAALAPSSRSR